MAGASAIALPPPDAPRARVVNRAFYDGLWSSGDLIEPPRFNTWPLVSALAEDAPARLEIGPGLRPRLPIAGSWFVDVSPPALARLRARGGRAVSGEIGALPFPGAAFDLVCAFDVVEHVADDRPVFGELVRVARPGATVVFSVPLHAARWSAFDELVGHVRRYEPADLLSRLAAHGLVLERSAAFGMEPRSRWLLDFAVWGLTRRPAQALGWYNRLFLPLGLRLQSRLAWRAGLIDVTRVNEVVLVCRRATRH